MRHDSVETWNFRWQKRYMQTTAFETTRSTNCSLASQNAAAAENGVELAVAFRRSSFKQRRQRGAEDEKSESRYEAPKRRERARAKHAAHRKQ
ncbi:hypothetical protein DPMN_034917 [Dreissena polymorpha]|uniref:Uncharacterized protein n=1 Tax=Dreissena polymorpha TaxID=45954 RepID=A0A9D4MAY9_DREPO|nr:hypothetical protein DPMN_034917 [Dreissena polymorpha]